MSSRPSLVRVAARSFPFVFGLALLVFGLPILLTGLRVGAGERALKRDGVVSRGTVIERSLNRETSPKKGSESRTVYMLRYRFPAGSGTSVEGEQALSEATWKRLQRDGPVAIRYLPADPFVNRVDAEPRGGGERLTIAGAAMTVAGWAFFLPGLLAVRRTRMILRRGMVLDAKVARIDERTVRGRKSYTIHYTYRDPAGTAREGKSLPLTAAEAESWKVGASGRVRADPTRPERSVWVGRDS